MSKSGLTPICKECARKIALRVVNGKEQGATKDSVRLALRYLNKPFLERVWDSSIQEVENLASGKVKSNVWAAYIRQISMPNYIGMTYFDSDGLTSNESNNESSSNDITADELVESHVGKRLRVFQNAFGCQILTGGKVDIIYVIKIVSHHRKIDIHL